MTNQPLKERNMTRTMPPATVERITAQGVDYLIALDKADLTRDEHASGRAHGGYVATVKALALVMGSDEAAAVDAILAAMPDDD